MKPVKKDSGFTLLELMISMAIMGIILVILMAVLRLGFRSVEAGEKKIESLERIRASLNLIDAQIQSALPLFYEDQGEKKIFFKGEAGLLEFSTNYSLWEGGKGYVVASYQVVSGDQEKKSLTVSENRVGMESIKEIKLLDQLDEIYFTYFFKDPMEEKGKWIEEWKENTLIPERIQLHLKIRGKAVVLIFPIKNGTSLKAQLSHPGALIPKKNP